MTVPDAGSVLGAATLWQRIASSPPLVAGAPDLQAQVQPNGVDLTLESVWRLTDTGQIGIDDAERQLSGRVAVSPDADDYYRLDPGPYVVRLNELVSLPNDVMAFGRPRSSLARCGVALHTAVWDAGYRGRSEALLVVYNAAGFRVRRNARILQLVFCRLDRPTEPYQGHYQEENTG
ncbi:MAG: deoxyuridine 5'-triphosphate nucleotidohydrolase [Chloroflexi bacterium]|nr:deoxyuridine 5'-triphosphate nucleotidohydrolase [Chloroflexota bacterium]